MIHAVLFDLDETLLDRQSSLIVYLHRQFRRLRELQSPGNIRQRGLRCVASQEYLSLISASLEARTWCSVQLPPDQ